MKKQITMMLPLCLFAVAARAAEPQDAKPSTYVSAEDLVAQFEFYLQRVSEDLAEEGSFGELQQSRVPKDANTLAVLALVLGKHDKENKLQKAAPAVIPAAVEIGSAGTDYKKAAVGLAKLNAALQTSGKPEELAWEGVADIAELMLQVPRINSSLKRYVDDDRRFSRYIDKSIGSATTLAAIAQATMMDDTYCGDEEDHQEWIRHCATMRDAAAEIIAACRQKDQAAARQSYGKMMTACEACHASFK